MHEVLIEHPEAIIIGMSSAQLQGQYLDPKIVHVWTQRESDVKKFDMLGIPAKRVVVGFGRTDQVLSPFLEMVRASSLILWHTEVPLAKAMSGCLADWMDLNFVDACRVAVPCLGARLWGGCLIDAAWLTASLAQKKPLQPPLCFKACDVECDLASKIPSSAKDLLLHLCLPLRSYQTDLENTIVF